MSKDLITFYRKLTQKDCISLIEELAWNKKPKCPYCSSQHYTRLKNEYRYRCNSCHTAYSVTVKTLFHDTRLPLNKWLLAIHILLYEKKEISSRDLALTLEINKNTAWYLMKRIENSLSDTKDRQLILSIMEKSRGLNES